MKITQFDNATSFLDAARDALVTREAHNNLMLGICGRLAAKGDAEDEGYYVVARDDGGAIVAAAVMAPSSNLVMTEAPMEAVELMARHLLASERKVPGVIAPPAIAMRIAELWSERSGGSFARAMEQGIYRLDEVIPVDGVEGRLRKAMAEDHALVAGWMEGFAGETGQPGTREGAERAADGMIAEGRAWIWQTDIPVSMAAWAGPTPNGVRIYAVYTPPELRGRGYASACVAGLSRHLLDSGRRCCFLFTDLANPTSNGIYRRIGYRRVCDVDYYRLTPREGRQGDGG